MPGREFLPGILKKQRSLQADGEVIMAKYILRRLVMCLLVIFCASIVIFTIMYFVPGDPVEIMLGANATFEQKEELRQQLGLDQPYLVQLGSFLYNAFLRFDFGTSYTYMLLSSMKCSEDSPERLASVSPVSSSTFLYPLPLGYLCSIKTG